MNNQDDIEKSMNNHSMNELEADQKDDVEFGKSVIVKTDMPLSDADPESEVPVKRRPDPLTITFAVLALAVIVGFAVYFYMYVKSNVSFGMTLSEFSTSYHRSEGYMAISPVGMSFPECTVSDLSPTGKKDNSSRYFSGEVLSMMKYNIYVAGSINKSNDFIKSMKVSVTIPDGADIPDLQSEMCVVFMPFIQSIYPEMVSKDAVAFSQNLFSTQTTVISGDFAISAGVDEAAGLFYLIINPKDKA